MADFDTDYRVVNVVRSTFVSRPGGSMKACQKMDIPAAIEVAESDAARLERVLG